MHNSPPLVDDERCEVLKLLGLVLAAFPACHFLGSLALLVTGRVKRSVRQVLVQGIVMTTSTLMGLYLCNPFNCRRWWSRVADGMLFSFSILTLLFGFLIVAEMMLDSVASFSRRTEKFWPYAIPRLVLALLLIFTPPTVMLMLDPMIPVDSNLYSLAAFFTFPAGIVILKSIGYIDRTARLSKSKGLQVNHLRVLGFMATTTSTVFFLMSQLATLQSVEVYNLEAKFLEEYFVIVRLFVLMLGQVMMYLFNFKLCKGLLCCIKDTPPNNRASAAQVRASAAQARASAHKPLRPPTGSNQASALKSAKTMPVKHAFSTSKAQYSNKPPAKLFASIGPVGVPTSPLNTTAPSAAAPAPAVSPSTPLPLLPLRPPLVLEPIRSPAVQPPGMVASSGVEDGARVVVAVERLAEE